MKASASSKLPESKSVGIWIRVSTEDQAKGEAPEHHLERAKAYANTRGWKVAEIYDLAGQTGKAVMQHPEAQRMMRDVERRHITGIVFSKLARVSRSRRELEDLSDFFQKHNADLISMGESIDTGTAGGRMFFHLLGVFAQWEREEIAERVNASIKIRAKLGKNLGGAAPFGYTWKDNKLVLNPTEAPIRKLMYELFLENQRKKGVARLLNEAGYRTRKGARFTDTTVVRLLQDTTAKGFYRANHTYRDGKGKLHTKAESEWIHTPVEPIVSTELWNQCNALLEQRKDKNQLGPKPVQLFAGLLHCGCGGKMYVFVRSPKYVCPKCRNKIPIEDIEDIFQQELKDFFVSKEKIQQHLASANQNLEDKRRRLEAHNRQIEKVRSEMRKTYQLYQADQITPEGFGRIYRPLEDQERSLTAELPKLQGELDALEIHQVSADEVVAEASTLHHLWPKFTPDEKRRIIESITEKIVVKKDEIDITFSYMPSSIEFTKRQRTLSDSSRQPT